MQRYRYKTVTLMPTTFFYTSKCMFDNSILDWYNTFHIPRSQACVASQVHPKGEIPGIVLRIYNDLLPYSDNYNKQ